MANRFNQYRDVNYVGLPIDSYIQAAGAAEGENMNQLAQSKQALDAFNSIQAAARPDQEVKDDIISKIQGDLGGLVGKNLKNSDVLMGINKIVNNPNYIDQLSTVQANYNDNVARLAARKKYIEENGNNINTNRGDDIFDQYNAQGKAAFKKGIFSGLEPGKYIPVEDEIGKALDKGNKAGYKYDEISGRWIAEHDHVGLTTDDLVKKMSPKLNDPTYARQLKEYEYNMLRGYGNPNDPATYAAYNKDKVAEVDRHIAAGNDQLQQLMDKKKTLPPKQAHALDKNIEDTKRMLQGFANQKTMYATDTGGRMLRGDLYQNLLEGAVSPFTEHESLTVKDNPYALQATGSALAFSNASRLQAQGFRNKKALYDYTHTPKPGSGNDNMIPFPIVGGSNPNETYKTATSQAFTKQFGDLSIQSGAEQDKMDMTRHLGQAGEMNTKTETMDAFGHITKTPPKSQGPTDPKIIAFANFAKEKGFPVNIDLLNQNGKTPESQKEFDKVGRLYQNFKNGSAQSNIASLGVSLSPVLGKEGVKSLVFDAANSTGNVVTDENGKQVALADVFKKDPKMAAAFNDGSVSATYDASTNRIQVSKPDGTGVFYVTPPHDLQKYAQLQSGLTNPNGDVGKGYGLVSIGGYDNNMNYNRTLFQPVNVSADPKKPVFLNDLSDKDANQHLQGMFGSKADFKLDQRIPKNGASVFIQDGSGVSKLSYATYMKDPTKYKSANVVIATRDSQGNIDIVKPAGVTAEDVIQRTMQSYFQNEGKAYMVKPFASAKDKSGIYNSEDEVDENGNPILIN